MSCLLKLLFGVVANLSRRLFRETLYRIGSACSGCKEEVHDFAQESGARQGEEEPLEDFYKPVNREGAEALLFNRQDGTFIIRPSSSSSNQRYLLGVMSLVHERKMYHLEVRRRPTDRMVALGTPKSAEKCFRNVDALINYYVSNELLLYSADGDRTVTLLLPYTNRSLEFY